MVPTRGSSDEVQEAQLSEMARLMRVADRCDVADGVARLELVAADGGLLPSWQPGAHIDLVGPAGMVRQYSLCGDPGSASWRVAVLRIPAGRGGSAWVHDDLKPGVDVEVKGPRNHFALEDAEELLFIAGGIGITPIAPMVREVARRGAAWRLVYGGRSRASMAFVDDLVGLDPRRVRIVPEDEEGRLDLDEALGPPVADRRVYCCGPEPLLAAVEERMADRPERLHLERFAAAAPVDSAGDAFEIELASSGLRIIVAAGESIIDALAGAGLDVDFSCREGTCGTCETRVLGGVPDHRDSVLTAEEREAGDCMMICVGRCQSGPLVLDL